MTRKTFLNILFCLTTVFAAQAQTIEDVARSDQFTYFGVDFSRASIVNIYVDKSDMKEFIKSFNEGRAAERYQDVIKGKYRREKFDAELNTCRKRNSQIDLSNVGKSKDLFIEDIKKVAANYSNGKEGYGILFVVEEFEKLESYVWVAYINTKNGELISTKRYFFEVSMRRRYESWHAAIEVAIKRASSYLNSLK